MTDTDKILQAIAGLQQTVEKQGRSIEALHEGQKTLQGDIKSLQAGQKTLQTAVETQGNAITALQKGQETLQATAEHQEKQLVSLQTEIKGLNGRVDTLEIKVEAFHAEQKQANEEIIQIFHNIGEINQKEIEKRVERIERHLNLPPLNITAFLSKETSHACARRDDDGCRHHSPECPAARLGRDDDRARRDRACRGG